MRIGIALFACLAGSALLSSCGGSDNNDLTNPPSDEGGAGTAGSAGDASVGGAGGTGGSGGTGGAGGSIPDGGGGDGGTSPDSGGPAAIATLGDPCSEPGKLACAGHAQKLMLLCDGTKWVSNGVCPGTQFCDTRPEPFAGSCQEAIPGCVGLEPGAAVCEGVTLHVCGPDLVTSTVEQCASAELCQMNDGSHCAKCVDGQFRCNGADLEVCGADNTSWELLMTCSSAAICDAATGKCGNQVCAAGQHRCTGDILEKCNSSMTAFETVQACAAGLCDAPGKQCDVCHANTATCYNATTRLVCSPDGQALNSTPCPPPTGACIAGQCQACTPTSADYGSRILDMYLMVDRSGSMSGNRWTNQQAALNGFYQDPGSAGMGVAMRFFPLDDNCAPQEATCGGSAYATPLVPWGTLPTQAVPLQASLTATQPNGCFTPTQEALNGVLAGAKARQLAQPTHVAVAVIMSDGEPCCGDCPIETAAGLAPIAGNYYNGAPSIRTFAVSIGQGATSVLSAIVQQGGGQLYTPSETSAAEIQAALADIRDAAGPCVFPIPQPDGGITDPNAVSVGYLASGSTNPAPLAKVAGKPSCVGDGWYFDNPVTPSQILLCPASCAAMRVDPGAKVRVSVNTCN